MRITTHHLSIYFLTYGIPLIFALLIFYIASCAAGNNNENSTTTEPDFLLEEIEIREVEEDLSGEEPDGTRYYNLVERFDYHERVALTFYDIVATTFLRMQALQDLCEPNLRDSEVHQLVEQLMLQEVLLEILEGEFSILMAHYDSSNWFSPTYDATGLAKLEESPLNGVNIKIEKIRPRDPNHEIWVKECDEAIPKLKYDYPLEEILFNEGGWPFR